jgi:hypothetical protein
MPVAGVIEAEALAHAPSVSEQPVSRRDHGAELARRIGATGHAVFALSRGGRPKHLAPILRS